MSAETGVRVEPDHLVVEAGGTGHLVLLVENRTSIVDQYAIEVLGDAASWSTVDTPRAAVMPQATTAIEVTFRPPRTPYPRAGTLPVGFRVRSTQDASRVVVAEGYIELQPFVEIEGELTPKTARGRFSGAHRLRVANQGNAPVKVSVRAEVQQGDCKIDVPLDGFQIDPGDRETARIKVRPSRSVWQGGQEIHSYRLNVIPQGGKTLTIDATMRQLPIARVPTALIVAAALLLGGAYVAYGRGPNPFQSAFRPPWSGSPDVQPSPQPSPTPMPTVSASSTPTSGTPPTSGLPPPTSRSCLPGAPTAVAATAGDAQVTVQWSGPGPTCYVTGFTITGSPGNIVASAGANATSVVVAKLTNCTIYSFVVDAIGSGGAGPGSAPSNPATPGAGPPGPPTGVTATAGDAVATLTWQAPTNTGCAPVTGYAVKGTPGPVSVVVTATGGSAALTNLVDGTAYTFTVAAVNSAGAGQSAASNPVTPRCAALSALNLSTTPYNVYWQASGTCTPYSGTVLATWTSIFNVRTTHLYSFTASGLKPTGAVGYCAPFGTQSAVFNFTLQDSQGHSISGVTSFNGTFVVGC